MQRISSIPADRLGVWASTLCVVHCLVTPVLISLSAVVAHFMPAEERFHRGMAVGIAALGAIALIQGFRTHGRRRVLLLMGAGLLCIFFGAFYGDRLPSHVAEVCVTLLGSILMISAHRMNHTFCKDCRCCTETAAD
ncbi:MAG TPA: MerC domain-containing protein [Edaphobacter sp.]|nr:MerC domain-containing protein [Edaphobacter sp.]